MKSSSMVKMLLLAALSLFLLVARAEEPAATATRESVASDVQRARALLARAIIRYRQQGDEAFAAFNGPTEFVDGELYVWVLGTDGVMLASG